MKFIVLALIVALVASENIPGYILNHSNTGSIKPQASQDEYSQQSLTDLLKYNFQLLNGAQDTAKELIEEFGKGNLLNPVELNYLFVIEGKEQSELHNNNARINMKNSEQGQKLIDEVFNPSTNESLFRLIQQYFPKESRTPFYYYKSQGVKSESPYEKTFGIELKRDVSNNKLYFYDNQTKKQVGKQFDLQKCFEQRFPEYKIQKDQIIKQNSSLKIDIDEQNAKQVDIFLKDLCAVSELSSMFKKSAQPNFIAFALNYEDLADNTLIQDLLKNMYKKVSNNFANTIGQDKVFGQVVYVPELDSVETEKVGTMTPRILAQENESTNDDVVPDVSPAKQIKAWFLIGFSIVLALILIALFRQEITRDTLLYAKFIVTDGQR